MRRVLISGAGVAGPVLAYWLRRYGFAPTLVERTSVVRHGLGGHSVELVGPALAVVYRMGLGPAVREGRMSQRPVTLNRDDGPPAQLQLPPAATQQVELLRADLVKLLYEATRSEVEYLFNDSITGLRDDGRGVDVLFERSAPRRVDLVIGADGLHSVVRRLVFGPIEQFRHWLGGYLGVYSVPELPETWDRTLVRMDVGRIATAYGDHRSQQTQAVFVFRMPEEVRIDHRDRERQKLVLLGRFRDQSWPVPYLLEHLGEASDFYFESISQITLDSWYRGRIGLVGDAGYSPGPGVGAGTSLAVAAAYVLAGELAKARPDPIAGLYNYQEQIRRAVDQSRAVGLKALDSLVPASRTTVRATTPVFNLLARLPQGIQHLLVARNPTDRALSALNIPDYSRYLVRKIS